MFEPWAGIAVNQHKIFVKSNADVAFVANVGTNTLIRSLLSGFLTNTDAREVVQGALDWYNLFKQCGQGECVLP